MGIELNMKASSCLEDELMMAVEVVSFVAYPDFGLLEWSFWRRFPQENDDLLQQDVSMGCPASLKEGRRLLYGCRSQAGRIGDLSPHFVYTMN